MNDEQMSDEFKARMRRGLSTMAVRERMRERSRNRAIAGGALAALVVATVAVFGSQALGNLQSERDQAPPPTGTQTPVDTSIQSPEPTEPTETPADTEPAEPPPGLEGVAAGQPTVIDLESCAECGDAGAAGGDPVESHFDVYLLCEGSGTVSFGGEPWVDCSEHRAGTGFVALDVADWFDDGDPQFTTSSDFDGQLSVVEPGAPAVGESPGATATVWVTCTGSEGTVTVGGVLFDCSAPTPPAGELLRSSTLAAWGVPIEPGLLAPRIEVGPGSSVRVSYVVER